MSEKKPKNAPPAKEPIKPGKQVTTSSLLGKAAQKAIRRWLRGRGSDA